MASTYSPNLRIELIAVGEQSNTWGTTTNSNLGTLIEQAISGVVSVSVTAGNVTLSALNGATDQSRQMIIIATGTPGVARVITAPAVGKVYVVHNNSDASLSFIASGGTGVTLIAGAKKYIYCDGTNFYEAINALTVTSGTIDGTTIGATTATTGKFTTVQSTTVQSTIATGTAPFIVASTTAVANLTASTVTTNANLTGAVTSVGNATTVVTNANLTGAVTSVGNTTTVVTNANLTGDITSVGNATTLATVNSNVGSFTNASVTVNAKGLITAVSTGSVPIPAGTVTNFFQASAPTGWTQINTYTNHMIRIVSGTGGGSGGTDSPILNNTSIPAHTHSTPDHTHSGSTDSQGNHFHTDGTITYNSVNVAYGSTPASNGGVSSWEGGSFARKMVYSSTDGAHTHNLIVSSGGAGTSGANGGVSWTPQYLDNILCSKN